MGRPDQKRWKKAISDQRKTRKPKKFYTGACDENERLIPWGQRRPDYDEYGNLSPDGEWRDNIGESPDY